MNKIDQNFSTLTNVIKKFKDDVFSTQNSIKRTNLQNNKKQKLNKKKRNYFKFTPKELSYYNQINEKQRNTTSFINNPKNVSSESKSNINYFLFNSNKSRNSETNNYSKSNNKNKIKISKNIYRNNTNEYFILNNDRFLKENNEIMSHFRFKTKENINGKSFDNVNRKILLKNKSQILSNSKNDINILSATKKHKTRNGDFFNNDYYCLNNDLTGFYSSRNEKNIDNKKNMNIINSSNVDDTIQKAEYFDEYGKISYNKFIKNMNFKQSLLNDIYKLIEYKNYVIKKINDEKQINKEINLYKKLCKQLIGETDKSKLKEIIDDVEDIYIKDKKDEYMLDNLIDTFNFNIEK